VGWRGVMRSVAAEIRRQEREALRRQRELERQMAQLEKMEELERASLEVEGFQNQVEVLTTIHQQCSDSLDWASLADLVKPVSPAMSSQREDQALAKLAAYRPGFLDRTLGRADTKVEELRAEVVEAAHEDERVYQRALQDYHAACAEWDATCSLANEVLTGLPDAYLEAIRRVEPFRDMQQLGATVSCQVVDPRLVEATVRVPSEEAIPAEEKRLLKSGKLSTRQMPKTRFYALYHDFVCGCVLRVARELSAVLPIDMSIVTAVAHLLNTQTGHLEEQPILSVAVPRPTLATLNFDGLDPSDSMSNFVHHMAFRKTRGFAPVKRVQPADLQDA